eukprot:8288972-Pyramimonas_sp.AAC.1
MADNRDVGALVSAICYTGAQVLEVGNRSWAYVDEQLQEFMRDLERTLPGLTSRAASAHIQQALPHFVVSLVSA